MTDLESVNEKLKDVFGYHPQTGLPSYRVILVTDRYPTEKRFGEFNIFYGEVFLKTEKGVSEVLKYPGWEGFYVVEWLTHNQHHDVMSGAEGNPSFTYEPIWRFYDENEKPQPLDYRSCHFIVRMHRLSMSKTKWVKTNKEHEADDREAIRKEAQEIKEALKGSTSDTIDHLHYGTGVKLDSTKIFRG